MAEEPARFTPLRPAPPGRRVVLLLAPALWIVAFIALAVVVHETAAVAIALIVTLASLVVAIAFLVPTRAWRRREERAR